MFWIRSLVCFAVLCVLLQSSRWGGESSLALLYFCVLNVRLLLSFFDSFSRCHGLVYDCDCAISGSYYLSFRQNEKNTYAPYLNLQVKPRFFSGSLKKIYNFMHFERQNAFQNA